MAIRIDHCEERRPKSEDGLGTEKKCAVAGPRFGIVAPLRVTFVSQITLTVGCVLEVHKASYVLTQTQSQISDPLPQLPVRGLDGPVDLDFKLFFFVLPGHGNFLARRFEPYLRN